METLVTIIHVFVCIFLMITVLLQAGKGGGMGAAFGGGSSQGTVFGGSGAGNFLRRLTVTAAAVFMLTSMTLAWLSSSSVEDALIRYSAQQRRADELRNTALDDAREGAVDTPEGEDGTTDDGMTDDGTTDDGMTDDGTTDDGTAPADGDGAEATGDATGTVDSTSESPAPANDGAAEDGAAAAPAETNEAAAPAETNEAAAPAPAAQPVADEEPAAPAPATDDSAPPAGE